MILSNYYSSSLRNIIFIILAVNNGVVIGSLCGPMPDSRCKTLNKCFSTMVSALKQHDEEVCVENAAIGSSSIMIYLKALRQFCAPLINIDSESLTFEGRALYHVDVQPRLIGYKVVEDVETLTGLYKLIGELWPVQITVEAEREEQNKPVIIIEAGQEGSPDTVNFAMYIIEQLVACKEYNDLLRKVRWVILPSTNPDGMEYSRFDRKTWRKNMRNRPDGYSMGVDISRNFDSHWSICEQESEFSAYYPGPAAGSENETIFIKNVLNAYKKDIKAYLSLRRDGHAIMYPYAYSDNEVKNRDQLARVAGEIAAKVNQRAGSVQVFNNDSIYKINGKAVCGDSVDYAYDLGVYYTYEMRVFDGSDNQIITKFLTLPRGYETSLRTGYFNGIKELYNIIVSEQKNGHRF